MKKKTWTSSETCEKNWWMCYRLRMWGCLCESWKRGVGKEMLAREGGGRLQEPTRTPACTYLKRRGRGRLIIVCGAPRPTAWRGNKILVTVSLVHFCLPSSENLVKWPVLTLSGPVCSPGSDGWGKRRHERSVSLDSDKLEKKKKKKTRTKTMLWHALENSWGSKTGCCKWLSRVSFFCFVFCSKSIHEREKPNCHESHFPNC